MIHRPRLLSEQRLPVRCHLVRPSAPCKRGGAEPVLPAHPGRAAGTHGTHQHPPPCVPGRRLRAAQLAPAPRPRPTANPRCSPHSSPQQAHGHSVGPASASGLSLFCAEELLGGPVPPPPCPLPPRRGMRGARSNSSVGRLQGSAARGSRNTSPCSQHPVGRVQREARGGLWARTCFVGGSVKPPRYQNTAKFRPCRCGTEREGNRRGAAGAPARPWAQGRAPAVGSGRDLGFFFSPRVRAGAML